MSHPCILIVHPDASVRALLNSMIQSMGCRIEEAQSDPAAVRKLEHRAVDLVLAGCDPSDPEALELLAYLRRKAPERPCILLMMEPHPERAREALSRGAASVLRFPLPANHLRAAIAQALGVTDLPPKPAARAVPASGGPPDASAPAPPPAPPAVTPLRSPAAGVAPSAFGGIVGEDPSMLQAVELAASIAGSRAPVLLVGEQGTGKTLLARALHHESPRRDAPLVEFRCVGRAEHGLELDLFGQVSPSGGARPGGIALAQGGTLYIDEVSALGPATQARLLRVLHEGLYEPVGGRPARADVRFILGTREDLATLVERERFRPELYCRISVVTLNLPPLRHRGPDIQRLAEHFRARFSVAPGRPVHGFTPEALERLTRHDWPGNVMELEGAVEHAVARCQGLLIEPDHLQLGGDCTCSIRPAPMRRLAGDPPAILPLKEALEGPERQLILQALQALNWNRQETARVLDINRTTLYKKMKKYGLLYDEPVWAN